MIENLDNIKKCLSTINDIKQRLHATTSGDWKLFESQEGISIVATQDDTQSSPSAPIINTMHAELVRKIPIIKEDAEFIAHSKEDIAWLVEQTEELLEVFVVHNMQTKINKPSYQIVSGREILSFRDEFT